jgi:hypothetical protein
MTRIRSIPGVTSSPRPSFTFARFSNERISTINIGQTSSGEIQRTEKVDADAEPMEADVPETSASGFGFANLTYDIIAIGVEQAKAADESVALTDIPSTNTAGAGNKESSEEENIYDVVEVRIHIKQYCYRFKCDRVVATYFLPSPLTNLSITDIPT